MVKTLEKFPILTSSHVHFDISHSGCMIAWEYCYDNATPPRFLQLIEDRDIWGEKFSDTDAFVAVFYSTIPFEFEEYAKYEDEKTLKKTIKDGTIVLKCQQKEITEHIIPHAIEKQIVLNGKTYNTYVINTTVYASDIGAILAKKTCSNGEPCDFAIMWDYNHFKKVIKVSLRSDKHREPCIDVAEIAKMFDGNGHTNASGFSVIYPDPIDNVINNCDKSMTKRLVSASPFLLAFGLSLGTGAIGYTLGSKNK
jgi:oligoribonuclease NrnB/cAMP/cGMP phosphodiesterase (DHH superfamily)